MNRTERTEAFTKLNNAGEGFDPTNAKHRWTKISGAEDTSDVAVYESGVGKLILIANDDSDDGRWAVVV